MSRSTLTTAVRTATRLGAKLPKTFTDDLATLAATEERAHALAVVVGDTLAVVVVDTLADGRDPMTDPDVHQAIVARTLNGATGAIDTALADRARQCTEVHAAAVVEALRAPFAKAGAGVVAAMGKLGDVSLADTGAVVKLGGDAAKAWGDAQAAHQAIADIITAWKLLAQATGHVPWDARHATLVTADPPPADYIDGLPQVGKLDAWAIARRGWPLTLATPAEYRARLAAVTTEQARRQVHADGEFTRQYQRSTGITA